MSLMFYVRDIYVNSQPHVNVIAALQNCSLVVLEVTLHHKYKMTECWLELVSWFGCSWLAVVLL